MRNPARKALWFGAMVVVGVLLIGFGATHHVEGAEDWTSIVPLAIGFSLAPIGAVFLVMALFHVRGQALLLAGVGRLAEWHLTAGEWAKFRGFDGERMNDDIHRLGNDLWIRKQTPPEGVEVIVGEKSLMIDKSYHVLRPRGLPELRAIGWLDNSARPGRPPDCLEFELAYPRGRYGGVQLTTLRVPFPAEARDKATQVYHFFAPRLVRQPGIALRNPARTYKATAVLALVCAAAFGIGWAMAEETGWSTDATMVPMLLMVVGAVVGGFALLLGLLTLLLSANRG